MKAIRTLILILIAAMGLFQQAGAQGLKPGEDLINFKNDIDVGGILEMYRIHSNTRIIEAKGLPNTEKVNFAGQWVGTNEEILVLLEALLVQHGVAVIPFTKKLTKAVPVAVAHKEALAFSKGVNGDLPDADRYVTKIVQVKHIRPSELSKNLESLSRMPKAVQAFNESNTFILRDFAANVKRMMEFIEAVDVLIPTDKEIAIVPIRYANVLDVTDALSALTDDPRQGGSRSSSSRTSSSSSRLGSGSSRSGSSTIRRQTLGRSSSGSTRTSGGSTRTSGTSSRSGVTGQAAPLLGDTNIMAYERNNAIIVTANETNMAMVMKMVEKLDVVQPQVLIEAIIMDVELTKGLNYGISIKHDDPGKDTTGISSALGLKHGGNFFQGTNSINALTGGLNYWGFLNQSWEAAVQAVATDTRYDVLSRPRIQTSHAEQATLFVGETRPYVTGTTTDLTGGTRSTYEPTEIGITLDVMPYINPDGLVVMDIVQEISEIAGTEIIDGNNVPIMTKREAQSKVAVRSGEIIVLGGFIKSKATKIKSGVPVLKDIPLLGALFRNTEDSTVRKELIILMRPKVLPSPEAASEEARRMKQSLPAVLAAEYDEKKLEAELFERNKKLGIRPISPLEGRVEEPGVPVLPPPVPLP